jgi:hypothetical protein
MTGGTVTVAADAQGGWVPETYLYEINATATDQTVSCVQIGRIAAGESLSRLLRPDLQGGA